MEGTVEEYINRQNRDMQNMYKMYKPTDYPSLPESPATQGYAHVPSTSLYKYNKVFYIVFLLGGLVKGMIAAYNAGRYS